MKRQLVPYPTKEDALDWRDQAECRSPGRYPRADWLLPESGTLTPANALAQQVCGRCEARTDCLDYAIAERLSGAIWGGVPLRALHTWAVCHCGARFLRAAKTSGKPRVTCSRACWLASRDAGDTTHDTTGCLDVDQPTYDALKVGDHYPPAKGLGLTATEPPQELDAA